jgi:sarcosine oxidase gamma subunit
MTETEADFLRAVWSEAWGRTEERVAVTELPADAMALARNGYIDVQQDGPDLWRVALTIEGLDRARALLA